MSGAEAARHGLDGLPFRVRPRTGGPLDWRGVMNRMVANGVEPGLAERNAKLITEYQRQ